MMKTKLKNITFLILISSIIISCNCKDTYTYVPEENKLIYRQGELVIFRSNLGNSDTFKIDVSKKYHEITSGTCWFLYKVETDYEEFIDYNYIDIHSGKAIVYFEIKTELNDFHFSLLNEDNNCRYDSIGTYPFYSIDNIEYNNVYYRKSKLQTPCIYKEVYHNIPYGLLKYKLKNDEVWTIQR